MDVEVYVNDSIQKLIKNRILHKSNYTFTNYEQYDLKLGDNVVLYNSGTVWKIVPLFICLSYPIIYDTYVNDEEKYDVSIIVCPVTLRAVMFKGKFELEFYQNYTMILREGDDIIPIDFNNKINDKMVISDNKRIEIKIMTLKNSITMVQDAVFIKLKKKKTEKQIFDKSYYYNDKDINNNNIDIGSIHPKTLVYIVKYSSNTSEEDKYVILLGNDAVKNDVTGYNIANSKLNDYMAKFRTKIINKNGYIMPMLWYYAKEEYKKNKLVYMTPN
jgi:hypothetical protein